MTVPQTNEAEAGGPGMISSARVSVQLIADRSDLWVPGALATLAFLGWLPLVLALAAPTAGDVAFFATSLATASNFPLNVVLLGAFIVFGAVSASLLIAGAETLLLRALREVGGPLPDDGTFDQAMLRVWGAQLVAAIPALVAVAALGAGLAAVGPGEYQSPDIGGPILLRLAGDLWPMELALLVAILIWQVYGAAAVRRADESGSGFMRALREAARDVRRRPLRLAGVAVGTALLDAAWLIGSWILLGRLWSPIGALLAGRLTDLGTALLLVAFIAIWLCVVAIGGALHAWSSAWWSLELGYAAGEVARSGTGEGALPR